MPPLIRTGGQSGTLRRGLRDAFATAYESRAEQIRMELEGMADLNLPSDTSEEFYAYYESAAHPRFWPRGEKVAKAGFGAVQFSVENKDWGREVEWHKNDEDDDQLRTLRARAAQTGDNFALLQHRVFFQLLNGTTDVDLLPNSSLNAPDGAGLFSTTDGAGNARFGATNGNSLSGSGVSSSVDIRTDFFSVASQFGLFQDTEGQQLWNQSILDSGFIVLAARARLEKFTEAFNQNYTIAEATGGTANAAVQNLIISGGIKFELRTTQYITGDDWYVFLRGATHKPIFSQLRQEVEEVPFDEANSLEHAQTAHRSMIWRKREGWGLFLPYGAIKVDNS